MLLIYSICYDIIKMTLTNKFMKKKLISFSIDEDLAKRFSNLCKGKNLIQAGVLRDFIKEFINKQQKQ